MSGRSDPSSWSLQRLLRPHAGRFALAFVLGALTLLASLGLLALSGWFITAAAVAGTGVAAASFDIFRPGALIRLCAIVRTAGRYGERLLSHDVVLGVLADLRVRCYAVLARLAPEPLARWSEGELLQRVTADVDALDEAPLRAWLPLGWALLVLGVALVLVGSVSPVLLGAAWPWLVAAGIAVPLAAVHLAQRWAGRLAALAGRRRDRLVDLLRGLTTLCLCGAIASRREEWRHLDQAVIDGRFRQRLLEAGAQALVVLLVGLAGWSLLRAGDGPAVAAAVAAPWRVMTVLAALATLEAFVPAAAALHAWMHTRAAQERLAALEAAEPAVAFHGSIGTAATGGRLQVHGVVHRPAGRPTVIGPIDLAIAAGARVVLDGPSGAGKSTLLALLARTLDPAAGRLTLDGVPLAGYTEAALRASVAVLPQRPHLFAMSLADNLRLGDSGIDDARLRSVLAAVALDGFLDGLPRGLETPLGEYGAGLSGGEARRVALAGVLLRGASLVLLDEPFEGLDAATAARVATGIDRWVGEGTLVLVSHRPVAFARPAIRLHMVAGRLQAAGTS